MCSAKRSVEMRMRLIGFGLQAAGFGLQALGFGLWASGPAKHGTTACLGCTQGGVEPLARRFNLLRAGVARHVERLADADGYRGERLGNLRAIPAAQAPRAIGLAVER